MVRRDRIGWGCAAASMILALVPIAWIGRGCAQFLNQEAFSLAGCEGDLPTLRSTLARGAAINEADGEHDFLALTCAAGNGHDEAASFLLSRGADPYKSDARGANAYAIWTARKEWAKWKPLVRTSPPAR